MSDRVATLVSVNVGMPREVAWQGRTVFTGIWKDAGAGSASGPTTERRRRRPRATAPATGASSARSTSISSTRTTTGATSCTATTSSSASSVRTSPWTGSSDDEVCIGDRYRIGSALFEVTQPRVTCYRVGIRMDEPRMAALLTGHGRPGFYLRVLEEGVVEAGDAIVKVAAGPGRHDGRFRQRPALRGPSPRPRAARTGATRFPRSARAGRPPCSRCSSSSSRAASGGGNAGLTSLGPPPAWPGFRALRLVAKQPGERHRPVAGARVGRRRAAGPPRCRAVRHAQARTR